MYDVDVGADDIQDEARPEGVTPAVSTDHRMPHGVTDFYRTCIIDAVLERSYVEYVRRLCVPNESHWVHWDGTDDYARIPAVLITPNPGVAYGQVRTALLTLASEAGNLHSAGQAIGPGFSATKLWAYLGWIRKAEGVLSRLVSRADTLELLDWVGYESLMTMAPAWAASVGGNPQERILAELLSQEITKRVEALEAARMAVDAQMTTWAGGFSQTLVFDTSVYLSYIETLTEIDWGKFTVKGDQGIRLAVPMIVIDELDATKSDHLRGRASLALAVLDKALRTDGKLAEAPVPVEVMLFSDPMGHKRLPINDQEIITRTLALQAITQNPVTLLTCDTGMTLRAREASLTVKKLERQDFSRGNSRKEQPMQRKPSTAPA